MLDICRAVSRFLFSFVGGHVRFCFGGTYFIKFQCKGVEVVGSYSSPNSKYGD